MQPFRTLTDIAAPLLRANVDTDVIIPIARLVGIDWGNLGPYCFEPWRFRRDGSENPDFLLNQEPYRRAGILLSGANFGCGSSREGAVWALMGIGIKCVIAPSFSDIFQSNCFQNGLLPVVLPMPEIQAIADEVAADPERNPVIVDLAAQTVTTPRGRRLSFDIDPMRREALIEGLDEIGASLRRETEIEGFQARDRQERPWVYAAE